MSHERGIAPVPRIALIKESDMWSPWARWFELLTEAIYRVRTYSVVITTAVIPQNSESVQIFTVQGLSPRDIITVNKPSNTPGLNFSQVWVSSQNTLSIKFVNTTGTAITPISEIYSIVAIRG